VGEGERIEEGQDTGRADWWVGSAQLGGEIVVGGVAVGRPRPYVLFSVFFFFFFYLAWRLKGMIFQFDKHVITLFLPS
jgi:hypothetical protein